MDLLERLKKLGDKARQLEGKLDTEEATKNALVMPFLAALGYDVFDPSEVVPEFIADVGVKRGEKVDYAIKRGDHIIMLVEAKKIGSSLSIECASQLYRYFSVTSARLALLTNGLRFRFYADLEEPNKMDSVPFLEIDLLELREGQVTELRKLTKEAFDIDNMLDAATGLKYMREILRVMEQLFDEPAEEVVRFFFQKANPTGRFSQSAKEQFTGLVRNAFAQVVSDRVSSRLRKTVGAEGPVLVGPVPRDDSPAVDDAPVDGIVTTLDERDGYSVVKAIVCSVVDPGRVAARDTKSYFGVLLDDNNRKPICRLHFNRTQKYLGLFDDQKNERREPIDSVDGIYRFADELRATVTRYETAQSDPQADIATQEATPPT